MGDATRGSSYETTTGANLTAYTVDQVTNARKDLRKSSISLGKSDSTFQTTAQRSFKSLTAEEVKNARPERTTAVRRIVTIAAPQKKTVRIIKKEPEIREETQKQTVDTFVDEVSEVTEVIDKQRHLINNVKLGHGEKSTWSTEARAQFAREDTILVERLDKKERKSGSNILMGLDKRTMVSTTKAATTDEKALYDVKYEKHQKDLRRTNFSLGTDKQSYASEASATFQNRGAAFYAAAMEKTTKDVQKTNYKMGTDTRDWKTTSHVERPVVSKEARQAAVDMKKISESVSEHVYLGSDFTVVSFDCIWKSWCCVCGARVWLWWLIGRTLGKPFYDWIGWLGR